MVVTTRKGEARFWKMDEQSKMAIEEAKWKIEIQTITIKPPPIRTIYQFSSIVKSAKQNTKKLI